MVKSNTHRVSVTLSPEQDALLEASVMSGHYPSKSEVLLEGLRLWEEKQLLENVDSDLLRKAYADGMDSGEPVVITVEDMLAEFKAVKHGKAAL